MTIESKLERTAFGLTILKNGHPEVRKLKRETGNATIHGNKFWKSTFLLMDYLTEFPPGENAKVLEIGCGWGLGGVFCAKEFGAEVTSLDADESVFPYLQHHAMINGVGVTTWSERYENIRQEDIAEFDLIVAADVCFWDTMSKPLFDLVGRAYQAETRVVMTDPGRPPFQEMAEKCASEYGALFDDWAVPHPYNVSGLVLDTAYEEDEYEDLDE